MPISVPESLEVIDKEGRSWGHVTLDWEHNSCLSGHLEPSARYEEVANLFLQHESGTDRSREIAGLAVKLLDAEGRVQLMPNLVFVSSELLLTCDISNPEPGAHEN